MKTKRTVVGLAAGAVTVVVTAMALIADGQPSRGALEIAVPGRTNANASLASSGSLAALAWGAGTTDGATDVYAAVSADGGRTFGAPVRVSGAAGGARLSGEQPAKIAFVPRPGRPPSVVVVWTAKAAQGTRLLSTRSEDGGRTFGPPVPVAGSEAPGNRGWESIAADEAGHVMAVWLDHRETAGGASGGMNHAGHQHSASGEQRADGVARAQLSKLFFGRLDGAAGAQAVTGGVCYCCKTSLAAGPGGAVYAAWRHVYPGNVRDVAFTKSSDGGRTFSAPIRVSDDNWVLDGCPENGPSLGVDGGGRVHIVWPTLVPGATAGAEPALALFHASSIDGRSFTPRQALPTDGFPRHPQIAVSPAELIAVWDEQAGSTRRIALARGRVTHDGALRFTRERAGDDAPAAYPVVAVADGAAIVAWVSGSGENTTIRVQRLPDAGATSSARPSARP